MDRETSKVFVDLTNINDSMQLDSGTVIATAEASGRIAEAVVCGDVDIYWFPDGDLYKDGENYKRPSDFPEELKKALADPGYSMFIDPRVEVINNNWFEVFIYESDGNGGIGNNICSYVAEDLERLGPEDLTKCLEGYIEHSMEIDGSGMRGL